jgi:uncharacterized protein (DUF1800 family)
MAAAWLGTLALSLSLTACGGAGSESEDAGPAAADERAGVASLVGPSDTDAAAAVAAVPTDTIALARAQADAEAEAALAEAALAAEAEVEAEAASQADDVLTGSAGEAASIEGRAYRASAKPLPDPASAGAGTDLIVRARGTSAGGVPPQMTLRVNGVVVGTASVSATEHTDYRFALPELPAGSLIDIVFTNDAWTGGQDRNLFIGLVSQGRRALVPTAGNAVFDRGPGERAFDGLDTVAGHGAMYSNGALRINWPGAMPADPQRPRMQDAARFLQQASFGPTAADLGALLTQPYGAWVDAQMALPYRPDFVGAVDARYALGDAYRPHGARYSASWVGQKFWQTAATGPDQLRKRVAFALHQIFMVSQADSGLWMHQRAYAAYYDLLNRHAFGNFRNLLEDVALSPAMGIYLSHLRNRPEDAATGRVPDENFAREIMQLFTIGLHELNADGSLKRNSRGEPVETYDNQDVMALAKVFTGWSWALPDSELTPNNFRWGGPVYSVAGDRRIDVLPMKAYPGQHSTAAKTLFAGKPWATSIAANGTPQSDLSQALDALFQHPNVGPFISRQLIQRLVTSHPSNAYVGRVAAAFGNNGRGVRGDLGAVVKAILLDAEARNTPPPGFGKLREPVLRVAAWMRALGARSASGDYTLAWELQGAGQRALHAPSVFGYSRPGYVPPNTAFAAIGRTAPEFQTVDESTVAGWINTAEGMAGSGLGWTGGVADVSVDHAALGALARNGDLSLLVDHLDLMLLGGRMSAPLRQAVLQALGNIWDGPDAPVHRARAATFLVLASPEYLSQP